MRLFLLLLFSCNITVPLEGAAIDGMALRFDFKLTDSSCCFKSTQCGHIVYDLFTSVYAAGTMITSVAVYEDDNFVDGSK